MLGIREVIKFCFMNQTALRFDLTFDVDMLQLMNIPPPISSDTTSFHSRQFIECCWKIRFAKQYKRSYKPHMVIDRSYDGHQAATFTWTSLQHYITFEKTRQTPRTTWYRVHAQPTNHQISDSHSKILYSSYLIGTLSKAVQEIEFIIKSTLFWLTFEQLGELVALKMRNVILSTVGCLVVLPSFHQQKRKLSRWCELTLNFD